MADALKLLPEGFELVASPDPIAALPEGFELVSDQPKPTPTGEPDRSFTGAALQGLGDPIRNIGKTLTVLGSDTVGPALERTPKVENYESATQRFMDPQQGDGSVFGFGYEYFPRAIVEQAGQIAGAIGSKVAGAAIGAGLGGAAGSVVPGAGTAAGAVTGGAAGAFAGPFLFEAMQIIGPVAEERAKRNGYTEPTKEDFAYAFSTAGASGALNALGAKYLPGGEKVVGDVVKAITRSMLGEGTTEAAQSVVQQIGETAQTKPGLEINPKQAIGEGLLGAGAGGASTGLFKGAEALAGNKPEAAPKTDPKTDTVDPAAPPVEPKPVEEFKFEPGELARLSVEELVTEDPRAALFIQESADAVQRGEATEDTLLSTVTAVAALKQMLPDARLTPQLLAQGRITDGDGNEIAGGYAGSIQRIRLNNLDPTSPMYDPVVTMAHEGMHHLQQLVKVGAAQHRDLAEWQRATDQVLSPALQKIQSGVVPSKAMSRTLRRQFSNDAIQYLDQTFASLPKQDVTMAEFQAYLTGAAFRDLVNGTRPEKRNFIGRGIDTLLRYVEAFTNKMLGRGYQTQADFVRAVGDGTVGKMLVERGVFASPQDQQQVKQFQQQFQQRAQEQQVAEPVAPVEAVEPVAPGEQQPQLQEAASRAEPIPEQFSRAEYATDRKIGNSAQKEFFGRQINPAEVSELSQRMRVPVAPGRIYYPVGDDTRGQRHVAARGHVKQFREIGFPNDIAALEYVTSKRDRIEVRSPGMYNISAPYKFKGKDYRIIAAINPSEDDPSKHAVVTLFPQDLSKDARRNEFAERNDRLTKLTPEERRRLIMSGEEFSRAQRETDGSSIRGAVNTSDRKIVSSSDQRLPSQDSMVPPPEGSLRTRTAFPSILKTASSIGDLPLGATDAVSGRAILQASNDMDRLLAEAERSKPEILGFLNRIVSDLPTGRLYGGRTKDRPGMLKKIEVKAGDSPDGAATMPDYFGARVIAGTETDLRTIVERLKVYNPLEVDDFLTTGKPGGYFAVHMQVPTGNGMTFELQIVPRQMQEVMSETHALRQPFKRYTAQDLKADPDLFARYTEAYDKATAIGTAAIERFRAAQTVAPSDEQFSRAAAQTGENVEEFKRWWGNSKVVDAQGEPQRMYIGTTRAFDRLGKAKSGALPGEKGPFFTSPSAKFATQFAENDFSKGGSGKEVKRGSRMIPAFVSAQNPFDFSNPDHVKAVSERLTPEERKATNAYPQMLARGPWNVLEKASVQRAIRDLGFDGFYLMEGGVKNLAVFDPKQIKSVFNPFKPGTADDERYSRAPGQVASEDLKDKSSREYGLYPYLRSVAPRTYDHARKILAGTNPGNAAKQLAALDQLLEAHPNTLLSDEAFADYLADAMGKAVTDGTVPLVPYNAVRFANNPELIAGMLRTLTPGQRKLADDGFKGADKFRQAYQSGKAKPEHTGKLILWGILSRGVSPFAQESAFLDVVKARGQYSDITKFIRDAAEGKFNPAEYAAWAKKILPDNSPGAGTTHNLQAFGKTTLMRLQERTPSGKTLLQELHDMIGDYSLSGRDIRRRFHELNTSIGINNKVLSFVLLVSGRNDVLVLDRVQMRNQFDDGRYAGYNLYDGTKVKTKTVRYDKDGKPLKPKEQTEPGTAIAGMGDGIFGLMYYEALERDLLPAIQRAYELAGRGDEASSGRYHWESWVAASAQEVDHGTIDGIIRDALGVVDPYGTVTTREGKYDTFNSGMVYGYDREGNPYVDLPDGKGQYFRFTPAEAKAIQKDIKRPRSGIIPSNFKVTDNDQGPWFENPAVNKDNLSRLLAGRGRPVRSGVRSTGETDADGPGLQSDAGQQDGTARTEARAEGEARATAQEVEQFSRATAQQQQINDRIQARPKTGWQQFTESLAGAKGRMRETFTQEALDFLAPIAKLERGANAGQLKDAIDSAYKKLRVANNSGSIAASAIVDGPMRLRDGGYENIPGETGLADIINGIERKFGAEGVHLWGGYVAAVRAFRLAQAGKERLMSARDIAQMVQLGQRYPEFEAARQQWVRFNDQILDFAEQTGTITPAQKTLWQQYGDYVPFYRIMSDDKLGAPSGAGAFARTGDVSKRLVGGSQQLGNVVENMILNTELLVRKSVRNHAMQQFEKDYAGTPLLTKAPRAKMTPGLATADSIRNEIARRLGVAPNDPVLNMIPMDPAIYSLTTLEPNMDPDVITVRGPSPDPNDPSTTRYYKVSDPLVLRALTFVPPSNSGLMRALTLPKEIFTASITAAPPFMLRNLFRDTLQARAVTNVGFWPFIDSAKGVAAGLKNTEGAKALRAGGGSPVGSFYSASHLRNFKRLTKSPATPFIATAENAWGLLQKLGEATENANRIAIRERALREGKSLAEANYQALDLMDFSLRGANGLVNFLIATVPFLNARMQGLYKLRRASGIGEGGDKENRTNFLLVGSVLALAAVALEAMNADDERYERENDVSKDNYLHIYLDKILPREALKAAGIDKWAKDYHIAIPKPFEVGQIFMTIPQRAYRLAAGNDGYKELKESVTGIVTNTFKMHPIELLPYPLKPITEQMLNYDTFRRRDIVPDYVATPGAPQYEYFYNTPEVLKSLGAVTGQSPLRIQKLIRDFGGTFGEYITMVGEMAWRSMNGIPPAVKLTPQDDFSSVASGYSSFVRSNTPLYTKHEQDFYKLAKEIDAIVKTFNRLKSDDTDKAIAFLDQKADEYGIRKAMDKSREQMSRIRKVKQSLYSTNDQAVAPDILEYEKLEGDITQRFMEMYSEIQKKNAK